MTIFQRRFVNAEIVGATGVTNDQLQNWMKRGLIIGQKDVEGGGGPGRHRTFSFFNLMEIAVAKALLDAGLDNLPRITQAAMSFAHAASGPLPGKPERLPGLPFNVPQSRTLLIVGRERSRTYLLTTNDSPLSLYVSIMEHGSGATVIDVSEVFHVVLRRLGIDPYMTLREAYGEKFS